MAEIELDTVFETAEVASLADEIMIDGLHADLRDCLEVLDEGGHPHGTILAAFKMAVVRMGHAADGPLVQVAKTLLRRLAEERQAEAKVKQKVGQSWNDD
jgi:hypothetical protein